jgi:hypothetical protein
MGESEMRHFELGEWADFARGVVDEERKETMNSHLESGCKSCGKVLKLWQRVSAIGRHTSAYEPPENTVRNAKAAVRFHPRKESVKFLRQPSKLLFDSQLHPQWAGVRSNESSVRQLLFESGDFNVDIRIEPIEDTVKVALIGQVLNARDLESQFMTAPVSLLKGAHRVVETVTNQFGEFRLEFILQEGLQLGILVPEGIELRVPVLIPIPVVCNQESQDIDSKRIKHMLPRTKKKGTRKQD